MSNEPDIPGLSDITDLNARSRQLSGFLKACRSSAEHSPLAKVQTFLLHRQQEDGGWAATDYPPWSDILTALTVQGLLESGFREDATWQVETGAGQRYPGGIRRAITHLQDRRGEHGWGEDIFDTCEVIKTFSMLRDRSRVEQDIRWGLDRLTEALETDFAEFTDSDWYGPGFFAAALEVLTLHNRKADAARVLGRIMEQQDPVDGFFGSPKCGADLRIFHTATCLSALHAQRLPACTEAIERALTWLESVQDPDSGRWGSGLSRMNSIYTAYAFLAISDFRGVPETVDAGGLQWLLDRQNPDDGRVESIEGTVMALHCFARAFPAPVSAALPLTHAVAITSALDRYQEVTESLAAGMREARRELAAVRADYHAEVNRYLLRLTHHRANQIGWIVGVIGLVLAVLAFLPW